MDAKPKTTTAARPPKPPELYCLLCGAGTRERYECEHPDCGPWLPRAEYDRRVALREEPRDGR
jgi:hypothetical protein